MYAFWIEIGDFPWSDISGSMARSVENIACVEWVVCGDRIACRLSTEIGRWGTTCILSGHWTNKHARTLCGIDRCVICSVR